MTRAQTIAHAESEARAVLRKANISRYPIDLDRVCARESISCISKALDDELSGMALVRNGQRFVIVNARHHENRRRFTLAHEVGHHILHADYLAKHVHVDTAVLRRDELSAEGVDLKEIAANAFAAELLMPRSHMLRFSALDIADEDEVADAAKAFGVSPAAFAYRLSNLAFRG